LGKGGKSHAALATCFLLPGPRNDYRPAIHYYRAALQVGYQRARVYNNLGFSQAMRARLPEARETLTKAIDLDPGLQAAYYNRACLRFRCIIPSLQRLLLMWSLYGQFLPATFPVITLADAPGDEKRSLAILLHETLPDLKKALELGPESGELHLRAAQAYALAAQLRPDLNGGQLSPDPNLSGQGLYHMLRALLLGCSTDELRRDPFLRAGLGHLPGYRAIVNQPPSGNTAARPAVRFLDLIDD
jgi:tetratricopeptide (TPR) repeat protein